MKCPNCDGLGYVFVNHTDCHFNMVCPKCKGRKEIDENGNPILTNEEYIHSLNTEELAKWIREDICAFSFWQRTYDWESWLKEVHRESE